MSTVPFIVKSPKFSVDWVSKDGNSDADLVVLLYNAFGQLLRACFNSQNEKIGGVTHNGDDSGGSGTESMMIDFEKVPPNVQFIVVAIALPDAGGHRNFAKLLIRCEQFQFQTDLLQLASTSATSVANFVPIICNRIANTPTFHITPANVMDNLPDSRGGVEHVWRASEFLLKQFIDPVIWNEIPHSHVELLRLKKNQKVHLPLGKQFCPLKLFGLGWSPNANSGEKFDLDLHLYTIDVDGERVVDHVYFGNKTSRDGAFCLTGDDRTGDGDEGSDDEQVLVSLKKIDRKIDAVFIVVQIFTGQTFGRVDNEFCRAVDEKGSTMVRFSLDKDAKFEKASAAVMCMLCRDETANGWTMSAIGEAISRNDVANDAVAYKTLVQFCR